MNREEGKKWEMTTANERNVNWKSFLCCAIEWHDSKSLLSFLTDIRKRSSGSQFYIWMSFYPKTVSKRVVEASHSYRKTVNGKLLRENSRQTICWTTFNENSMAFCACWNLSMTHVRHRPFLQPPQSEHIYKHEMKIRKAYLQCHPFPPHTLTWHDNNDILLIKLPFHWDPPSCREKFTES